MPQNSEPRQSSTDNFFGPPNPNFPYSTVYVALNGDNQSRLIRLLPGSRESPIHCTLVHNVDFRAGKCVDQGDEHNRHAGDGPRISYAALSYCAGDPNDTEPIWVDTHSFNVFRSLFDALKQIRHSTNPQLLWVDQICINQHDISERDSQVLLMKDIYENAQTVTIYLGEEEVCYGVSSNLAFDFLDAFWNANKAAVQRSINRLEGRSGNKHKSRKRWYQHYIQNSDGPESIDADLTSVIDRTGNYLTDAASGYFWVALMAILAKPWWTRCWVIQEVIVARKATIECGERAIDFDDFDLFLFTVSLSLDLRNHGENADDRTARLVRSLHMTLLQPLRVAQARRDFDARTATPLNLLQTFAEAKASDSRDKVYSTLALLGRDRAQRFGLTPNYAPTNTTTAVFIQAAKACIAASEMLEAFSETYGNPSNDQLKLPSWVPNWTHTVEKLSARSSLLYKSHGFSATGRAGMASAADVRYSHDGLKIIVRGILIGKVIRIGVVDALVDQRTTESLSNIVTTLKSWKQLCNPKSITEIKQFCQTVTLDRQTQPDALAWTDADSFEAWAATYVQTQRSTGAGRTSYGRRFGQVTHGEATTMAMLPADAEVGDIVCAFWGANVPFVLKKRGNVYRLAGEAYVHGAMHGELVEDAARAWRESVYYEIA